ncbi:MAG: cache domain-containing protein, partial [Methylococcales bacterium]
MNKIYPKETVRIVLSFLVFILVVGLMFISALVFWIKPELDAELRESVDKDFERITLAIHQHLQHASVTAQALANAAKLMPVVSQEQNQLIKPLFKSIIATPGSEYLIAGGGIWPEPFQFNPEKERDSYFWGRNKDNRLIFYNEYNLLAGPGYHHQEWYMPARYIEPGSVYWSKSYIDPYSLQPMVTATVPIVSDGNFIGVSTVDVKLEGLGELLQVINERYLRKVFLVDRNLQIIAKPLVQSFENGVLEVDNLFYDMAEFKQVEAVLNEHREKRIVKAQDDLEIRQLAKAMSLAQGEINVDEGLLIASGVHLKKGKGSSFFTANPVMDDAILSEQRILFYQLIPSLQWTIAIVEDRVDIP